MPKRDHDIGKAANNLDIFIDTSAWIALFSRRDQHHYDADVRFRTVITAKQQMLTTNLIVGETHRLLLQRAGNRAAMAALERIEASSLVQTIFADSTHHTSAKEWLEKLSGYPITYTDAISFSVMNSLGCTKAMSFDRHFSVAGFDVLSGAPGSAPK